MEELESKILAMRTYFGKIISDRSVLEARICLLERDLKSYVKFPFVIMHQFGDGYYLVNKNYSNGRRLSECFNIIEEKGFLTEEDFNKISI